MTANPQNVKRLTDAAFDGIKTVVAGTSAEDVVCALLSLAHGGITAALSPSFPPEVLAQNRQAIRAELQRMLLMTVDASQVM